MSIALLVVAKCFFFQKESRLNNGTLIFRLLFFFVVLYTLTLSKSRNGSFNFKGYNVCSLYSCPLSSYTPCSYRQGGKKNIPVSNKSEIHQGPQSVHSPFLVQIVLHSAAQQMHFVHKCQWIKHFRSFFQGGN